MGGKPGSSMTTRQGRTERVEARAQTDDLKRPWRAFLEERGLNDSKAREAIVDAFLEVTDHVDLETLLEVARRRNPSVGMATVYRTMKLMEEAGLAHVRHFGSGAALYEVAVGREHHDHLICEACGRIVEFVSPEIEKLQDDIAARNGFKIHRHSHEMYGVCASCRSERRGSGK